MADIEVVGLRELTSRLELLGVKIQKDAVRNALKPAAEVFRREIRVHAPVRQDPGLKKAKAGKLRKPGYLKLHIGRWLRTNPGEGSISAFIGPTPSAFYGRFVEKGHKFRRAKVASELKTAEFGGRDTSPHPFMRPAFDGKKNEAQEVFGQELMKQIEAALR